MTVTAGTPPGPAGRRPRRQHALPERGAGGPDRGRGAEAASEVGVRLPRRHIRLVAADGGRRPAVRRQPERHGLRARREERLHRLDVHREERRAHRAGVRRAQRRSGLHASTSATPARTSTRSTPRPGRCAGPGEWTSTRSRASPARRRSTASACTCRSSSLEETAANQPGYECCTFRGSVAALDAATGDVIWQTYFVPPARSRSARTPPGHHAVGAVGRRRCGRRRPSTRSAVRLRRDRQHLQRHRRRADDRRGHGARPQDRRAQVVEAAHRGRRVRLPRRRRELPGEGRARTSTSARRRCSSTRATAVTSSCSGRSRGWPTRSTRTSEGELLWQYRAGQGSIWGGIQWGMAADGDSVVLPGLRHPHAEARRAPRGEPHDAASASGISRRRR